MKVEFTVHERRVFELPTTGEMTGPEALALRRMLNEMPWLTTVADCRFDDNVRNAAIVFEGAMIQFRRAVEQHQAMQRMGAAEPQPPQAKQGGGE
jgi:hypothetical protein